MKDMPQTAPPIMSRFANAGKPSTGERNGLITCELKDLALAAADLKSAYDGLCERISCVCGQIPATPCQPGSPEPDLPILGETIRTVRREVRAIEQGLRIMTSAIEL